VGSPRIEDLLPPPPAPGREVPWRALAAFLLPAAALAAGTGLQRVMEGSATAGDPVLRWLCWSAGAGLALGALAGLALGRKLLWAAYGAAAPWMAAGLVAGGTLAARPLAEKLADRREAGCRAEGRAVCSAAEFTARCAEASAEPARARSLLGEPRQSACTAQGCAWRWVYAGPFRPDAPAAPSALHCSVLTDAQGRGVRHWMMAEEGPQD
jgi:hypothetical protein